jgi:hypothetical protein
MSVVIGIDPHKGSHAAAAMNGADQAVAEFEVRASSRQASELLAWAERFGERRWAVESANGHGYLLAQQLVAAGEHVVDVPSTLASRARVLDSTRSQKNDANDARSVAIVALHQRAPSSRRRGSCGGAADAGQTPQAADQPQNPSCLTFPCRIGSAAGWGNVWRALLPQAVSNAAADPTQDHGRNRKEADRPPTPRRGAAAGEGEESLFGASHRGGGSLRHRPHRDLRCRSCRRRPVDRIRRRCDPVPDSTPLCRLQRDRIEMSSGGRKRHRLNPRGNRMLNHAIHLIAITSCGIPAPKGGCFTSGNSKKARPRRKRSDR